MNNGLAREEKSPR